MNEALIRLFEGASLSASAIARHTVETPGLSRSERASPYARNFDAAGYVPQKSMVVPVWATLACCSWLGERDREGAPYQWRADVD